MGTKIKDLPLLPTPLAMDVEIPVSNLTGTYRTDMYSVVGLLSAVYVPETTIYVRDNNSNEYIADTIKFGTNTAVTYYTTVDRKIITVEPSIQLSSADVSKGSVTGFNFTNGLTASNTGQIGLDRAVVSSILEGERIPVGMIGVFAVTAVPVNWLVCDGSEVSRTDYPELWVALGTTWGTSTDPTKFVLPDLRGEFLRMWDAGRGVDSGRAFGSVQSGQNLTHTHSGVTDAAGVHEHTAAVLNPSKLGTGSLEYTCISGNTSSAGSHTHTLIIDSEGGAEARPRNVAVLPCIKATFAATTTSVTPGPSTGGSTPTPTTGFESSLTTNGYQKLPTGYLMQWGQTTSVTQFTPFAVTFPLAFPTQCLYIGFIDSQPSASTTPVANPYIIARSTTGFSASYPRTGTTVMLWYAVGY